MAIGLSFFVAPELEYFYFSPPDTDFARSPPMPLDNGSFFDLTTNDLASEVRRQTVLTLEDMGIPVEYSQHEDAPSQHEIDLRYTDALTMADTVMTVRMVVKEMAEKRNHGHVHAQTPFGVQGSGMHTHMSLFDESPTPSTTRTRVPTLRGGLPVHRRGVAHARELTAVTNQWVNSYKRLIVGYEAPVYVAGPATTVRPWSGSRLPSGASSESTRIEYRAPTRPATRIWRSPPSGRRPDRDREGIRAARRGGRQHLRSFTR